jgi:hypothetical protein
MENYILYDHDEEGKFYSQSLFLVCRTSDISSGYVGAHDFKDR